MGASGAQGITLIVVIIIITINIVIIIIITINIIIIINTGSYRAHDGSTLDESTALNKSGERALLRYVGPRC